MDALELNGWLWLAWSSCWFLAAAFTRRANKRKESFSSRLKHTIPTVIAFELIFFVEFGPRLPGPAVIYQILTVLGLLYTVWARIHLGRNWSGVVTLKENHELIRSGPFRYTRHPIYTGFLCAALGSALINGTTPALTGWLILIATYVQKAKHEELWLSEEFGDSYKTYMHETPRLLPFRFETFHSETKR